MGSSSTIEIDSLIAPISEDSPSGIEFDKADADSEYYRVKALRDLAKKCEEDAQEALMLGDDADPVDSPDWGVVISSASEVLMNTSKDFRIVCWLAEALVREHGFAGLRDGLLVSLRVCQTYWDQLHPAPNEEEGHAETVAMFNALTSDAAIRYLKQLPITGAIEDIRYSLADYASMEDSDDEAEEESGPRTAQTVSYAEFQQAVMAAEPSFYRDLIDDLNEALNELHELSSLFDEKCLPDEYDQPSSPSTTQLREELEDAKRIVIAIAQPLLETDEELEDEEGGSEEGASRGPRGAVASREEAFRSLQKVVEFFERTEPHSPISFALRQVIGWGRMSLPELLKDLITDESVRDELTRRVGVPLSEAGSED